MYVASRIASKQLGVCGATLRKWADEGRIKFIRTDSGQRRYDVSSVCSSGRRRILYSRVSSRGQKQELISQSKYLRDRYPDHELIEDQGSGLNFKRKGFAAILDAILLGTVEEVVVVHRDRLCRFGFELLEKVAGANNCRIVVLDNPQLSPQEELVRDLVSIIHVFSCRIYGLRRYATEVSKDKDIPHGSKSTSDEEVYTPEPSVVQQDNSISATT